MESQKNLFTGWRDIDLSENGVAEARSAGRKLKAQNLSFDVGFTSALVRAQRSLDSILDELGQSDIPVFRDAALNERDYGELSGLNKDDARAKWGTEQVHLWRRSYDVAPPGGESLRDTAARVLPYYIQKICPQFSRKSACSLPRTGIRCAHSSWCSSTSPPPISLSAKSARAFRSSIGSTSIPLSRKKSILRLDSCAVRSADDAAVLSLAELGASRPASCLGERRGERNCKALLLLWTQKYGNGQTPAMRDQE